RDVAWTRGRRGDDEPVDGNARAHREAQRDQTAHAVPEHDDAAQSPLLARLFDDGGQVVDVVVEAHHAGALPLAEPVTAVVGRADGHTVGDEAGGDGRVAAPLFRETLGDDHHTGRW